MSKQDVPVTSYALGIKLLKTAASAIGSRRASLGLSRNGSNIQLKVVEHVDPSDQVMRVLL